MTSEYRRLRDLVLCLKNDLRGPWKLECDELGIRICEATSPHWTLWTAYATDGGFSAYRAINDTLRGNDCDDEKPLVVNGTMFAAVNAIVKEHREIFPDAYTLPKEVWEQHMEDAVGVRGYRAAFTQE